MAENNNEETIPGFTLQSQHFIVKFVAGFTNGVSCKLLEYETDWTELMTIILEYLEMFPTSVKTVEEILAKAIDDWIILDWIAENIKSSVKMAEEVYFSPPLGSEKSLTVSFPDVLKTEVVFHIKKKSIMKTLKDLGAAAVVENLRSENDIAKLEIPVTLFLDLVKANRNDFSLKYYKSNINCCPNHREGTIDQSQFCNLPKRQNESNLKKQPQNKKRKVEIIEKN